MNFILKSVFVKRSFFMFKFLTFHNIYFIFRTNLFVILLKKIEVPQGIVVCKIFMEI